MRLMNATFSAGSLVLVLGVIATMGGLFAGMRPLLEPSLYVAAGGAILMAASPVIAIIGWLIGWRD